MEPRDLRHKSWLNRFSQWYLWLEPGTQRTARAVPFAFATVGIAALSAVIALAWPHKLVLVYVVVGAVVFVVVVYFVALLIGENIEAVREAKAKDERDRRAVIEAARDLAHRAAVSEIKWLSTGASNADHVPAQPLIMIERLVQAAFDTLESQYGAGSSLTTEIDFGVTFMTKSYRDGEITIPASANRTGTTPRSMQARVTDPQLYMNTVTADVYRDPLHRPIIVENTDDPAWRHRFNLYEEQRDNIKSQIVWPILASDGGMLGTLVMRCDRKFFFLERDRKFWYRICEVFGGHLAIAKLQLDRLHDAGGSDFAEGDGPPF